MYRFIPDLVAFEGLIVDTKVINRIGGAEYGQMLNYLRVTGLRAGLILNFYRSRLEWKRIVF
ncbi:MAG: GxxExxY protein [Halofilum sp. (in: g-proteobacteria)]|nr:GxxExxY protein [Halofilum sp. (in: g-proteobacteria)]